MKLKLILLGMLLFTGLLWSPLKAQNLIVNGTFDVNHPTPTPTSMICDVSPWAWQASVSSSYWPLTGIQWEDDWHPTWWIDISDCGYGNGRWVKQSVNTVIGQSYIIGLDLHSAAWWTAGVDVYLNGTLVAHFENPHTGNPSVYDWERFEICWTATATITEFKLVGNSPAGSSCPVIGIDSVVMIPSDSIPFDITLSDQCVPATVGIQTPVLGYPIWYYNGSFLDSGVNYVNAITPGIYRIAYITACGDTLIKDTVVIDCDTCRPEVDARDFCIGQPTLFDFTFPECFNSLCLGNFTVYYGDGTFEVVAPGNPLSYSHLYPAIGPYTVQYCWFDLCANQTYCDSFTINIIDCDTCRPETNIHEFCAEEPTYFEFNFDVDCFNTDCIGVMTIDYGDGSNDVIQAPGPYNFSHTYATPGTYTVTYCWEDVCAGMIHCVTTEVTIEDCSCPPTLEMDKFCVGDLTTFDFTFDPECETCISGMTIQFGDANSASGGAPYSFGNVYPGPGTYLVEYCWTNECTRKTYCKIVQVTIIECCAPSVGINGYCYGDLTNFYFTFNDPECEPCDGTMTVDFGDGTVKSETAAPHFPFEFKHSYAAPGTYTVKYCWNDCNGFTHCLMTTITIYRCDEVPAPNTLNETIDNSLSLFPNPAQNKVMLRGITAEKGVSKVEVLGADGKLILSIPVEAGKTELEIPLDKLSSGTYLIRVLGEQPAVDLKLVKE